MFGNMQRLLAKYNVYDIAPQSAGTITIAKTFCHDGAITQSMCVALIFLIVGADPPQLNTVS